MAAAGVEVEAEMATRPQVNLSYVHLICLYSIIQGDYFLLRLHRAR